MQYNSQEALQELNKVRTTPTFVQRFSDLPLDYALLQNFAPWGNRYGEAQIYKENGILVGHPTTVSPLPTIQKAEIPKLDSQTQSLLGSNGVKRFEKFKKNTNGWFFGKGKALNPDSVRGLNIFCRYMPLSLHIRPSLFLNENGNLALSWENNITGAIELEFIGFGIRYSFETLDKEGEASLRNFIEEFSSIILI